MSASDVTAPDRHATAFNKASSEEAIFSHVAAAFSRAEITVEREGGSYVTDCCCSCSLQKEMETVSCKMTVERQKKRGTDNGREPKPPSRRNRNRTRSVFFYCSNVSVKKKRGEGDEEEPRKERGRTKEGELSLDSQIETSRSPWREGIQDKNCVKKAQFKLRFFF